jgi:hypothetical protein
MVPLGLVLNELITNSFKHAFKGRNAGHIKLTIVRCTGWSLRPPVPMTGWGSRGKDPIGRIDTWVSA